MKRPEYSDSQYKELCAFCGAIADTRDHVPSKILLDEPFPVGIPYVPCCHKCNNEFSKCEEYFACAIECCKHATADISKLSRDKVIKAMERNSILRDKLERSIVTQKDLFDKETIQFNFDTDKIIKVITKLAKGHARFEHSTPFLSEPKYLFFELLSNLSKEELHSFYREPNIDKAPEVGSRGVDTLFINSISGNPVYKWQTVQENHYKYLVYYDYKNDNTVVNIELANTFCIQVVL